MFDELMARVEFGYNGDFGKLQNECKSNIEMFKICLNQKIIDFEQFGKLVNAQTKYFSNELKDGASNPVYFLN